MTPEEICNVIISTLRKKCDEPDVILSGMAQALVTFMLAVCEMNDYSDEVCEASMKMLSDMQDTLMTVANEHTSGPKWHTLGELKEEIEACRKPADEADKNARTNACKNIMDAKTLGFLLVSYMEGGSLKLGSNLVEETAQEKVLTFFRETLYGKQQLHMRFDDMEG